MPPESEIAAEKKEGAGRRLAKLLLKVLVTAICFWYVSKKIDFSEALQSLQTANPFYLALSVTLYALSKIVAAFRLNSYFKNINLNLPTPQNLRLYWLGMFYNLFLPGSISGDAYKVVTLNKRLHAPYKKTGAAVLLDRFSGLLGLGAILSVYGLLVLPEKAVGLVLVAGTIIAAALLYLLTKKFFADFLPGFWSTFLLGVAVQAIQVAGVYLIMAALHIDAGLQQWVFVFLAANVVSVLPLSLGGGLGTREVVFAAGAGFFHLPAQVGVTVSLLFYLTSVAASVWGAWYVFRDPLRGAVSAKGNPAPAPPKSTNI